MIARWSAGSPPPTYLSARVPRIQCSEHKVKQVSTFHIPSPRRLQGHTGLTNPCHLVEMLAVETLIIFLSFLCAISTLVTIGVRFQSTL